MFGLPLACLISPGGFYPSVFIVPCNNPILAPIFAKDNAVYLPIPVMKMIFSFVRLLYIFLKGSSSQF